MADIFQDIVNDTASNENLSDAVIDGKKPPASPEGMVVAYSSLIVMALLPIFFGSLRSLKHQKALASGILGSCDQQGRQDLEVVSKKDAAMFPLIASATLFGLYIFFQIFSKEYVNLILTAYFFVLGVLSLTHVTSPILTSLIPSSIPNISYHLLFNKKGKGDETESLIDYKFTTHEIVCLFLCLIVGVSYVLNKHWIINNLFGMAFAINGVELLHLNNIVTGCILLCGLFVYDIFWVFGTNVMVTVAKSFEAPIKIVFPQDLLEHGFTANNFAMLGLGDIVIPGIFIALLLRFDTSLKRNSKIYFYTTFVAYFVGLVATIFVMHTFKHAQPALLYLVPLCVGTPLLLALVRGDINAMFLYEDHPAEEQEGEKKKKDKEPVSNIKVSTDSKKVK